MQEQTNVLQQAIEQMNQRNYIGAEQLCCDVLNMNARSTDAATLLGLIWMNDGQLDRAEQQVQASLNISAQQPGACNILGSIHRKQGRPSEAIDDYRQAIALASGFSEAWLNLGVAQKDTGDLDDAEVSMKKAIAIEKTYPQAHLLLGVLYRETERPDKALAEFQAAVDENPRHVQALYYLGVAHREAKNYDLALRALNAAIDVNPSLVQGLYVIAGIYDTQGKTQDAITFLKRAIDINPDYGEAHKELNKLLWETGKKDEFLQSYIRGVERVPDSTGLRLGQAEFLLRTDQIEEAAEKARLTLVRDAGNPYIHDCLGRALTRLGNHEEALEHHHKALGPDGNVDVFLVNRAASLMYLGKFSEAINDLEKCDRSGDRTRPQNMEQLRIAMIAQCYLEVGDPRGAVLNDYDRFVKKKALPIPDGYSTIAEFNQELLNELEKLHTLNEHPIDQSLRKNGTQTRGHLFANPNPIIQKLRQSLILNFQSYIDELDDEADHPFLLRKGHNIGFTGGWSVRLRDQGFHASHIHSDGWISSAYYVSLPPEVAAGSNEDKRAGHIHFGRPDLLPGEDDDPKFWVEPEEGYQAMFPSYAWHGTQPFQSDSPRVTVAMDVTAD